MAAVAPQVIVEAPHHHLIAAGAAIDILDSESRGGSDDADTWLLTLAICVPIAVSVTTVLSYCVARDPFRAFAVGLTAGAALQTVVVACYRLGGFGVASHARVDTYNEICQRMDRALRATGDPDPDALVHQAQVRAAQAVRAQGEAFANARAKRGLHWLLGKGYVDLFGLVHGAEELVIVYEPVEQVVSDAFMDWSRLSGSQVPGRDDLLARLCHAMGVLDAGCAAYLPLTGMPGAPAGAHVPTSAATLPPALAARTALRDVRHRINVFRDGHRRTLLRARDDLLDTLFLTGLVTCLLLALLLVGRPHVSTLVGGATLYALGMLVGLFVHLSAAPDPSTQQEDYGLRALALFQIAELSGIAAVLGAYVGVALPVFMDVNKGSALPPPATVYDLASYPAALVFGLIFAVAPRLLVQRLAAGVNQTQLELKTSSAR